MELCPQDRTPSHLPLLSPVQNNLPKQGKVDLLPLLHQELGG